jgi:ABC-2 type transport system ATP-binding protein
LAENDGEDAPALRVEHVSHSYGARRALDDVSFTVPAGVFFCVLLGLNGAGKSTLFSLLTRLYATRSGSIRVYGADIAAAPGRALAQLGVVFQSRALDLDLSVAQNLAYHAALHGLDAAQARARSLAALARVDMASSFADPASSLSGGQARRVEIARALLHRPRLLLLDEPTVGLDVRARRIMSHVRALTREGVGVLWATHLLDEVSDGDHVVVLHKGRVLARGTRADVVSQAEARDLREAFATLTREELEEAT